MAATGAAEKQGEQGFLPDGTSTTGRMSGWRDGAVLMSLLVCFHSRSMFDVCAKGRVGSGLDGLDSSSRVRAHALMHAREQSTGHRAAKWIHRYFESLMAVLNFVSASPFGLGGFVGLTHTEARHQHNILVVPYIHRIYLWARLGASG
jgi:hypothetical protein